MDHDPWRSRSFKLAVLVGLLSLVTPGRVRASEQEAPGAEEAAERSASNSPDDAEPGWLDALVADDANVVGLITAGSGVVGGLGVCALVALSPTCCALPLGFPIAALTTGAGASVAAAVMGDWACGRLWLPALAGTFLGATTGLFASISGLIAYTLIGSAMGVSTFDPAAATASTLLVAGLAGAATLGVAVLGSALTGVLVRFMYALTDDRAGSRSDPPRARTPRRRAAGAPPAGRSAPAEAPGFEY